jgi:hypothetical protein
LSVARLPHAASPPQAAGQVSGAFKSLVTLVGFAFVFFVPFVVHELGKRF